MHAAIPGRPVLTVAVVTGGGSGISAALCRMIAVPSRALLVHAGKIRKAPSRHSAISGEACAPALAAIPLGRLGTPEEVAAAIAFLLSPTPSPRRIKDRPKRPGEASPGLWLR